MFSMLKKHSGAYPLIIEDRGTDWLVFSGLEQHGGTYILIEDGWMDGEIG